MRDEMRLAQIEVASKAKRAGVGAGIIGAGGLLALYGLGVLIAATMLALALVIDAWLAALIVAVVIFVIAGIAASWARTASRRPVPRFPKRPSRASRPTSTPSVTPRPLNRRTP